MLPWPRAAEGKKTLNGVAVRARFQIVRADDTAIFRPTLYWWFLGAHAACGIMLCIGR
jgi:hypothetical protein